MLIRVQVSEEEEIFLNCNCQVDLLLDTIKKSQNIPRSELIDLCTVTGEVKYLHKHEKGNGLKFFALRELCLVVNVFYPSASQQPYFTPYLAQYATKEFQALINQKEKLLSATKSKARLRQPTISHPKSTIDLTGHGGKKRSGKTKKRFNAAKNQ